MRVILFCLIVYFLSSALIAMDNEALKRTVLPNKTLSHDFAVKSLCYSGDGKYLIVGGDKSQNSPIRVWQVNNTSLPVMDLINAARVEAIDCNDTIIASACNNVCKLWDLESGNCTAILRDSETDHEVKKIHYNSDGSLLISTNGTQCKIWDIKSSECVYTYRGHEGVVYDAQWKPNDTIVASCSADNTTKLWDRRKETGYIQQIRNPQLALAFCASGRQLITASSHLFVYNADTTALENTYNLHGKLQESRGSKICQSSHIIRSLAMMPETDEYIIAHNDHGTLCICNQNKQEKSVIVSTNTEKDADGAVAISPDGNTVAVSSYDEQLVRFWQFKDLLLGKKETKEKIKEKECCTIH